MTVKHRILKKWCTFRGHDYNVVITPMGQSVLVVKTCLVCGNINKEYVNEYNKNTF